MKQFLVPHNFGRLLVVLEVRFGEEEEEEVMVTEGELDFLLLVGTPVLLKN